MSIALKGMQDDCLGEGLLVNLRRENLDNVSWGRNDINGKDLRMRSLEIVSRFLFVLSD